MTQFIVISDLETNIGGIYLFWLLFALGAALFYGINDIFKWIAEKGLSKTCVQFYFHLIAFLIILIYGVTYGKITFSYLSLIGMLIGILNAVANIQITNSFAHGPSGITAVLIQSHSVLFIIVTSIVFPQSITWMQWFGVVLLLIAAFIMQYEPSTESKPIDRLPWFLHMGSSIILIALLNFLMKVASYYQVDTLNVFIPMFGGAVIFLAFFVHKEWFHLKKYNQEKKIAIAGSIFSLLGHFCFFQALKIGPATFVMAIISLACMVVIINGILFFKEKIRSYQWVGIAVALVGLVFMRI
jgi:drug/metabolite transporter (DMT)-like permease